MALRITTWNVNGIRNPFGYHPWSQNKSFRHMFDTLDADIVCFQETKIQPKDLTDDMVLVPGFDSYFTFPKQKKGYSGVAVYTRNSKCTPIKAEEGITGALQSLSQPGKSYRLLEPDECIGGYPDLSKEEAVKLDSEGRALVLDFGAFVLIGAYCPAATDPSRDHFRACFVEALCTRVRKLVNDLKRRVVVVGDLNIAREEIDACDSNETMKEAGMTDWKDTLTRASLDRLLLPHPSGVVYDLCRERYPDRTGMFTCWDVKKNKRPGNAGSRIDYILCSPNMSNWFGEVNIQEGLMGSDHCPVFGVINPTVDVEGTRRSIIDLSSPEGKFRDGVLQPSFTAPPLPRLCMKRFPEYSQRQNIKGMFARMASTAKRPASDIEDNRPTSIKNLINPPDEEPTPTAPPAKRAKRSDNLSNTAKPKAASKTATKNTRSKAQSTRGGGKPQPGIRSFMQPVASALGAGSGVCLGQQDASPIQYTPSTRYSPIAPAPQPNEPNEHRPVKQPYNPPPEHSNASTTQPDPREYAPAATATATATATSNSYDVYTPDPNSGSYASSSSAPPISSPDRPATATATADLIDPVESMQQWKAIFTKKPPPLCDFHSEPCVQRVSGKPGVNGGRAFWVCSRPIGPDGESAAKSGVRNEWQCNFFKWCEREG